MRRRRVQLTAGRRGGAVRWRRAAVLTMAAALPVTVITAAAVPASASGGYTVTATIPVGGFPYGVAVDPVTGTAYVANASTDTVSAIDEATDTVTDTIAVGSYPVGVAVDPRTQTVYVVNGGDGTVNAPDGTVSVIDEATDTVTATIAVGKQPIEVAVDPTTHTAYVTNAGDGTVSVISADGDQQAGSVTRFRGPTISSANHATFRHDKHGRFIVRAKGLPAPSVTEAGKLPPGLRFTAGAKGAAVIAGTPAASAKGKAYAITFTARDGHGKDATQRFTLRVS